MARLSVLAPQESVNYIKNPSFRYDTTDWNAQGATLTRVLTRARFGIASLKVVTAGSALREGAYFRVSALSGYSGVVTVSAYVRGNGRVRIRLDNNVIGGREMPGPDTDLTDERWTRLSVTGFSTGGNDLRLYVETSEAAAVVRTFYVDGAQMEKQEAATTYIDGDQPGCRWNGIYHASTSQRPSSTRLGGKWVQLAGKEREEEDLYMTVAGGLGMAPITNNLQSFAQAPGGYFNSHKVNERVTTLTFHAKHRVDDGQDTPVSLGHLHNLRQMLIDLIKPDRTTGDEALWFEYEDGTRPIRFRARYDGGLEGEWDIRNQFVNSFPLRLLAVDPLMSEDSQEAAELDFQNTLPVNFTFARINGRWSNLNYGFSQDYPRGFGGGRKGEIFVVFFGPPLLANNNAAAINPQITATSLMYYDGEKWVTQGPATALGGASAGMAALAVAPNGDVYVTGQFTSIGGTAANNVARWNGSAWSALGTGLSTGVNDQGHAIAIAPNGDVYVGGLFTTAGGVNCANIARWDGLKWNRLGTYGGLNGRVRTIAISQDGSLLYAGGEFTDQNGNPGSVFTRVALYNISTGLFSAMGSGFDAGVYSLELSHGGALYAGGWFTASGSNPVAAAAEWVGNSWIPLAGLSSAQINELHTLEDDTILALGRFLFSDDPKVKYAALWNGSAWVNLDFDLPAISATDFVQKGFADHRTGDLYFSNNWSAGGGFLQQIECSGLTVVNNPGSSFGWPVIYIQGSGIVRWIENQTIGKRLYLNLSILDHEEVFIDIGRGTLESTVRGSLLYTLLPGSDFRSFGLVPGDNLLACFMTDDVSAQMSIQFVPQHWGVDAGGLVDA